MINHLVKEVRDSLKSGNYIAGLITALTLPDICGKAEYPGTKSKERYTEWLRKYAKTQFDNPISAGQIYQLRCRFLHESVMETCKEGENDGIDFELIVQPQNRARQDMWFNYGMPQKTVLSVNVVFLCELICFAAENYYKNNKEKFDFVKWNVVNTPYATAMTFGLSEEARRVPLKK